MTTFLIAALVVMTLICIALIWALFQQNKVIKYQNDYQHDCLKLNDEKLESMHSYISGFTKTLYDFTGGIGKRITESEEIICTINSLAPELFVKHKGLLYWLHANDQFLVKLSVVAGIDDHHHSPKATDAREAFFNRLYQAANLQNPIILVDAV